MRRSRMPSVARQLLAEIPDADLLERYVLHRADDAFAQLVTRYSRLVWGQCRNLLPDDADADDAFQATFLTLARSAKSIRTGAPLGPWLHGVAYRVCMNARRAIGRRAKREKACAQPEVDRPVADSRWESAFAAVSEEVQKLPESQRTAFVLCCIEGRATTDAAASLGQKLGTFSARLTRAKQTLLDRLAKRGLGAGVLAIGGVTGSVAVAPAALIERTLRLVPSGVTIPSSVQSLTQGVTGMMMIRFKLLAAGVLVATGLGLSIGGGWSNSATAQDSKPAPASGQGKVPPGFYVQPPKGNPTIEQLRAELERAKAELANAEAHAKQREVELKLEVEKSRRLDREKALPTKYEYEPLPKSLTPKEFEAKLAEREKGGWAFVGQVDLNLGDKGNAGPTLVFRKQPMTIIKEHVHVIEGDPKSGITTIKVGDAAAPKSGITTIKVDDANPKTGGSPKTTIKVDDKIPNTGGTPKVDWTVKEIEMTRGESQDGELATKIAELEKLLATLKANQAQGDKNPGAAITSVTLGAQEFGNWDPKLLAEVLMKALSDDDRTKPGVVKLAIENTQDGIKLTGNKEGIAAAIAWIKKLKK